jgi:hypothetical protein
MKKEKQQISNAESCETKVVTREELLSWRVPKFQRDCHIERRPVQQFAQQIVEKGGVIAGVFHHGLVLDDPVVWLVDGQQRRAAAETTDFQKFQVNIRMTLFQSVAEMAQAYLDDQTQLVAHRVDDKLKAMQYTHPPLRKLIRSSCAGIERIRATESSPRVSAATAIRAWSVSARDFPAGRASAGTRIADELTDDNVDSLIRFLSLTKEAWPWGRESNALWGALNMTMCSWFYRRFHFDQAYRDKKLNFVAGLAAMNDQAYLAFLRGKGVVDENIIASYRYFRDRMRPALSAAAGKRIRFPGPPVREHHVMIEAPASLPLGEVLNGHGKFLIDETPAY